MNKQQKRRATKRKKSEQQTHEKQASNSHPEFASHGLTGDGLDRKGETASNKPSALTRPHSLTITLAVISILVACVALYWNIKQPDIRYVASLTPETMTVLESKIDSSGNFVHNFRLRPTFINYSIKPGFIDKAEFVPQTIATLPEIKITSINKTPILWHQKKQIEITFLMTVPTDVAQNPNSIRDLAVDQVLSVYDNTGKKIERAESGIFARIRLNFRDTVNTRVTGTH